MTPIVRRGTDASTFHGDYHHPITHGLNIRSIEWWENIPDCPFYVRLSCTIWHVGVELKKSATTTREFRVILPSA